MHTRFVSLAAAFFAVSALAAACGPSTPGPETPSTSGEAEPPEPGEPSEPTEPGTQPEPGGAATSVNIQPSTMLADVQKLGIDLKKAPDLEKIPLATKKKIMPFFQKALGYDACTGCHAEGDYKKETKNIKMARGMWNHYVAKLRDDKGGPVFCDSCHNGKSKLLAREDKDALQKFMEEQYQNKMSRADGEEHSCSTCHGGEFETKIFEKMWGIK
jgi:hypothetical protein